ncbi:hypothetical protein [Streptomyces purpurascens]
MQKSPLELQRLCSVLRSGGQDVPQLRDSAFVVVLGGDRLVLVWARRWARRCGGRPAEP